MKNKIIWQNIFKHLRQNHDINLTLKGKRIELNSAIVQWDVLNSVMALLEGREMVFQAFESGIISKLKQSEQSSSDDKYTS